MYAFGPLPRQKNTGRIIGTHQKIDRVARKHLRRYLAKDAEFPKISEILYFEGQRGPDGVKLKSPGRDEPWHFIDPKKPSGELLESIDHHIANLADALIRHDGVRASFEAAWLAHAVSDGLTPAHHDSLHEQLHEIKRHNSTSRTQKVRSKIIMSGGGSSKEFIKNNWGYWGAKGIMTTHTLFEAGVAAAAKPFSFETGLPSVHDIQQVTDEGFESVYIRLVAEVASLDMYATFKEKGWTSSLARQTNKDLLPRVIMAVTLAWYAAYKKYQEQQS
ncbi:hypothetical protein KBD87_01300 [Candidatus Saccharibacteria bacterium]|nr:hypothetical protein [Candidatus Saccharibacteria bacterium]